MVHPFGCILRAVARCGDFVHIARWITAAAALVMLLPSAEADDEQRPEVVHAVLIDDPAFAVSVAVHSRAKPSLREWVRFEIKNKTDQPLTIVRLSSRVEAVATRLDNGTRFPLPLSTHYLQGPQLFQLIYADRPVPTPSHPLVLPPGEERIDTTMTSRKWTTALGVPPEGGLRIEGHWIVDAEIEGGRRFRVARPDRPVRFQWGPISEEEVSALADECRRLVIAKEMSTAEREWRRTLLGDDRTNVKITADDAATALRNGGTAPMTTFEIGKFVDPRFIGAPAVIETYRDLIQAGNTDAVNQLRNHPSLWHKSYVDDLVGLCAGYDRKYFPALLLLDDHRVDWQDRWQVSILLSVGVRRAYRKVLSKPPTQLSEKQIDEWAEAADALSRTNDLKMIAVLKPGLDDVRRLRIGVNENSATLVKFLRPLRVCDAALDGIVRLLEETIEPIYASAGLYNPLGVGGDFKRMQQKFDDARDRMIASLRERLIKRDASER